MTLPFFHVTLFALMATTAAAFEPCVNYNVVGMSECEPEMVTETTVVTPAPKPTTPPPPPTLDDRIDDFIETYDKPPREFVAFHLEPTLENALTWVRKYNEMLQRNLDITEAWTQAEEIYLQNLRQGVDVTQQLPAVQNATPLAAVPDFGVPIERFRPVVPELALLEQGQISPTEQRIGAFAGTTQEMSNELTGFTNPALGQSWQPTPVAPATNPINPLQASEKIQIDYYFSATCPYCAQFEPEFQQLITEFSNQVDVTCIDVTPTQRVATNILGKVDCTWRPAAPGEAQQMGIQATPSLIIRRGAGQPLERVTGYVPASRLRTHLFSQL